MKPSWTPNEKARAVPEGRIVVAQDHSCPREPTQAVWNGAWGEGRLRRRGCFSEPGLQGLRDIVGRAHEDCLHAGCARALDVFREVVEEEHAPGRRADLARDLLVRRNLRLALAQEVRDEH